MNKILVLAVCLLFPALAHAWSANVLQVVDGDTITVAPAGQTDAPMRVRLYGIDAPERDQPYGSESTTALAAMLPIGEEVDIITLDTDRYGRTVGLVIHDGMTANRELLKQGAAWVYPKYCKAYFCRKWMGTAKQAKKQNAGLWATPDPTPPWKWRNRG